MTRKQAENKLKLTRSMLMKEAGTLYFGRGEEYFDMGMVEAVHLRDSTIQGTVSGTHVYRTQIELADGRAAGICTCPLGDKGRFCKHLVATGLAFIDQEQNAGSSAGKNKTVTLKDVEDYLAKQDVSELAGIILEHASQDGEFYSMLRIKVAAETTPSMKREMKTALRKAMYITDFITWRGTSSYSSGVEGVLDQLRGMLSPKHAADIVDLTEYGMELWEEAIELIDDSDGCMGIIWEELHELHLAACGLAKPDPQELAERLASRAIDSSWDMFGGGYEMYWDILGDSGRARYREIVEEAWKSLPPLKEGQEDPERYGSTGRLERMMLAFAKEDGDLDLIIRILSRDLSSPYQYLRIAERCRKARKYRLAREWAEKGLTVFPKKPDSRLRIFLAEEYLRAKRPDAALAMVWQNFDERQSLATYKELAEFAKKLKQWEAWRGKAFDTMRATFLEKLATYQRECGKSSRRQWCPPSPPDNSLMVEILLWEKRNEEAWDEARETGCSESLWLELARRREKEHPEDAIEIYKRQVVPLVERTDNRSYEEAVGFLDRIYHLSEQASKLDDFCQWLVQLKYQFKRKRNFIKYVERRSWGK